MRFHITHITRYAYASPASESFMEARLIPRTDGRQRLLAHTLQTSPATSLHAYTDYFGNAVETFSIIRRHATLMVTSVSEVETAAFEAPAVARNVSVAEARQLYRSDPLFLLEFLLPSPAIPLPGEIRRLAGRFFKEGEPIGTSLQTLNRWVHEHFTYQPGRTRIDTPISKVLKTRTGVCQDFVQIVTAVLRAAGIPARYVTGYIETGAVAPPANGGRPSVAAIPGEPAHLIGTSENHAWVEAFLPGGFWLPLDPTNNCIAGDRHVAVSVGRDYHDSTPTRGVFKGTHTRSLAVSVLMRQFAADTEN